MKRFRSSEPDADAVDLFILIFWADILIVLILIIPVVKLSLLILVAWLYNVDGNELHLFTPYEDT